MVKIILIFYSPQRHKEHKEKYTLFEISRDETGVLKLRFSTPDHGKYQRTKIYPSSHPLCPLCLCGEIMDFILSRYLKLKPCANIIAYTEPQSAQS